MFYNFSWITLLLLQYIRNKSTLYYTWRSLVHIYIYIYICSPRAQVWLDHVGSTLSLWLLFMALSFAQSFVLHSGFQVPKSFSVHSISSVQECKTTNWEGSRTNHLLIYIYIYISVYRYTHTYISNVSFQGTTWRQNWRPDDMLRGSFA